MFCVVLLGRIVVLGLLLSVLHGIAGYDFCSRSWFCWVGFLCSVFCVVFCMVLLGGIFVLGLLLSVLHGFAG